ncbi:hypothetical protein BC793_104127 [Actinoplanes xinjiangensis]|uniref:Uncharacterized protein n=2 Tax=Actinoplanes TaxID=1865 RepID=A0A1H2C9L1_9ACTN|nr:hypothetical protein BC793_104127 [Actinoplanes xinjiangensis]GID88958.1 hypothetical protein Ade03nite_78820 [Actinoplanes derwentensis]GIF37459.1 hypothetical protein Axi01nite_17700 [Actinoplanes xinjiangensis]SDT67019.1 hypothetical protein SAMN04489716_5417 [Actinoplanes derwentensis]
MISPSDPLWRAAQQAADCLSQAGYAFVEDDRIEGLATTVQRFLESVGIPTNPGGETRRSA